MKLLNSLMWALPWVSSMVSSISVLFQWLPDEMKKVYVVSLLWFQMHEVTGICTVNISQIAIEVLHEVYLLLSFRPTFLI